MKCQIRCRWLIGVLFWIAATPVFAAVAGSSKTTERPSSGYSVIGNHEEIVAKAKKEGKLRILTTMDDADIRLNTAAFKKKYPFLDVKALQSRGTDSAQRLLLEIKSGMASDWDV